MSSSSHWPAGRQAEQSHQQSFQQQPVSSVQYQDAFPYQQEHQQSQLLPGGHQQPEVYSAYQQQQQQQPQQLLQQQYMISHHHHHHQYDYSVQQQQHGGPATTSGLSAASTSPGKSGNASTLSSAFGVQYPSFRQQSNQNYMTSEGLNYTSDASLMMGMGLDIPQSTAEAPTSAASNIPTITTFSGHEDYTGNRSGFHWANLESSSVDPGPENFNLYDVGGSSEANYMSGGGSNSSSSANSNQYHYNGQPPIQQQKQSSQRQVSSRFNEPNSSLQRPRKPAALALHEPGHDSHVQSNQYPSPGDAITPNASRLRQNHEHRRHDAHPMPSPTWQQTSTPASSYTSGGLLSPVQIQDAIMTDFHSNASYSTAPYGSDAVVHPPYELVRPLSSASAVSFTSSRDSGGPSNMQRSGSLGEGQTSAFEQAFMMNQTGSGLQSWASSGPDSPSQQQHQIRSGQTQQRRISTPQRLQQMRDSIMMSTQMSSPAQMAPSTSGSYTIPAATLSDFDYTDHRLSAALANNAHISSSSGSVDPSTPSRSQRGNTTPTIMEEEESGFKILLHQDQQASAQAQSLSHVRTQKQQEQQQQQVVPPFRQSQSDTLKKHRPNIRPNIYQQYAPFNLTFTDEPMKDLQDCTPFIDEVLHSFLASPSRLGMGERSVLIMTSKVAQKSYGAEKRFLSPPPMVLLVGSSWWSACHDGSRAYDDSEPTVLTPPRLNISMSGESTLQDSVLEWASSSGRLIDVGNPSSEMAISGRSIGRQLFINDSDEKRRHCEALAHITVPGLSGSDRRSLGTFASKPIKVISKPSKKRQSTRASDLSVNHGSTISLFHRLRSQTVSTRYLCVSGAPTWFKGSDGVPFLNSDANAHIPNQGEPSSCFVAKMSSWDPFIIYVVDPHIEAANAAGSNTGKAPLAPGYPPPPINVMPLPANGQGPPICYNQAVVLQCLNTAVVSPVMIIRKVDRGTTIVGGGQPSGGKTDSTAETLGDPVSQLHKIAFEVLEDPKAPAPVADNRDVTSPGQSGHFLGCLNEDVGLRRPLGPRQWVASSISGPPTPTTPITPMNIASNSSNSSKNTTTTTTTSSTSGSDYLDPTKMSNEPISAANMAAVQAAAAQTRLSHSLRRGGINMSPSSSSMAGPSNNSSLMHYKSASQSQPGLSSSPNLTSGDEDGNMTKRPRRVSSSVVVMQKDRIGNAAKNRRRGQSLSIVGMQNQLNSQQQQQQLQQQQHLQQQQQQQQQYQQLHHYNQQQQQQQQQAAMQSSFPLTSVSSSSSNDSRLHLRRTSSFANSLSASETSSLGIPAGAMWTVDVHDSDIWTIVGTEIARHTFYLPTKLIGGVRAKSDSTDQAIAHLINVPAPATPITPLPSVHSFASPDSSSSSSSSISTSEQYLKGNSNNKSRPDGSGEYVTLMGDNLTSDLFVYFGDWRSTRVFNENKTTLYCEPPPQFEEYGLPRGKVPIVLVRRDGVVFPTPLIYQC